MFQNLFDILKMVVSIILAGISIKLLDDFIDENNRDFVPYIFLTSCVSITIWSESSSLFLSTYIVGMFHDETLRLVSRLKSYHEQMLAFIASILLSGFTATLSSFLIICTIQFLDDLIDEKADRISCKKNWAVKLGEVETIIITTSFFLLSIFLNSLKTLICITTAIIISFIFNRVHAKR